MTLIALAGNYKRLVGAFAAALVVLALSAGAASASTVEFFDAHGDANGINDQLEGFCCDVSTPVASQPSADIVATSVGTLYSDGRAVATELRITTAGRIQDGDFAYELRMQSARCGSIFGFFTANNGSITEECDKSRTRVRHGVAVHSDGRTLFVRIPYDLNPAAGVLSPGDVLSHFQTISNRGVGPLAPPRLDWANAPRAMTFEVKPV